MNKSEDCSNLSKSREQQTTKPINKKVASLITCVTNLRRSSTLSLKT